MIHAPPIASRVRLIKTRSFLQAATSHCSTRLASQARAAVDSIVQCAADSPGATSRVLHPP
ncbi:hypothetical protein XHC_1293 [Xanthomonas hortorum pv. carotae str. M081]|nr:hypothetical protein XHC_1293 [Xanthomonas hortorum pv. carotae str. M081]